MGVIGFGAWAIGGPARLGGRAIGWGAVDPDETEELLGALPELGVNVIDTADVYGRGRSEGRIGAVYGDANGRRDEVFLVTKAGNREIDGQAVKDYSPTWLGQALRGSVRRLGVERVDLFLLHTPDPDFDFPEDTRVACEKLVEDGLCDAWGMSVANPEQGVRAVDAGFGSALQVIHNLLDRRAERTLFDHARAHRIGIMARVPLASGFLAAKRSPHEEFTPDDWRSNWNPADIARKGEAGRRLRELCEADESPAVLALRFALTHSAVGVVIPGARSLAQARTNATAGDLGPLGGERMSEIEAAMESFVDPVNA